MAVTSSDPAPPSAPASNGPALFTYSASKDGMTIVSLFGFERDGKEVVVEAEIHSVKAPADSEPMRRSLMFPTRELAQRFADETVIAFEYVGCIVP